MPLLITFFIVNSYYQSNWSKIYLQSAVKYDHMCETRHFWVIFIMSLNLDPWKPKLQETKAFGEGFWFLYGGQWQD